ncbi:hypothetical protein BGZ93_008159 [Podila epicladia]|nr:hypothetical protein BGZ93_008159 [Podila epicladia]
MTDTALRIPHILNSITYPLSFSDLISCILACHKWHDLFIHILWTDVVTFRSKLTARRDKWIYHDYSRTTHGQQALLKNAQHIRALTCYAPHSLQLLRASTCVNLVEVNYLVNGGNPVELSAGLENLAELISLNLQLTAVSIEGISLDAEEARDKLSRFLDFLETKPKITSVYFEPGPGLDTSYNQHWKDVWYRLLSRVSASTIHSVQVQDHVTLTRSKRALNGRRAWVARESPIIVKIRDSELSREYRGTVGGRWESEHRRLSPPYGYRSTTVMEHNGHLVLVMPHSMSWSEYTAAMTRFQGIQRLTVDKNTDLIVTIFLDPAKRLFPDLTSLDIRYYESNKKPMDSPLDNLAGLTSLSLNLESSEPDWNTMSRHYSVMTSLSLPIVLLDQFYDIVSGCPLLQELTGFLVLEESAPVAYPQWICSLRKLHLHIWDDIETYYSDTEDEIAVKIDQATQFAKRIAPPFMRQLGSQTLLKDLKLCFNTDEKPDVSPFLELSLDAGCGLPQLASLQELRSVVVCGLQHSIGQEEIEWMKRHWPRLHSLEVPILQKPPYVGESAVEWRDTFKGQVPEYNRWFPGLEVMVPNHCYGYWVEGRLQVKIEIL